MTCQGFLKFFLVNLWKWFPSHSRRVSFDLSTRLVGTYPPLTEAAWAGAASGTTMIQLLHVCDHVLHATIFRRRHAAPVSFALFYPQSRAFSRLLRKSARLYARVDPGAPRGPRLKHWDKTLTAASAGRKRIRSLAKRARSESWQSKRVKPAQVRTRRWRGFPRRRQLLQMKTERGALILRWPLVRSHTVCVCVFRRLPSPEMLRPHKSSDTFNTVGRRRPCCCCCCCW